MTPRRIIDIAQLERLLHLSGATGAPMLIAALISDLQTTQAGLEKAWNGPDFAVLSANAHVLIALSGTIGDTDLQILAQSLFANSHAQNRVDLMDMKPKIMAGLSDLISVLAHLQNRTGA
jgi:hypothetical protein